MIFLIYWTVFLSFSWAVFSRFHLSHMTLVERQTAQKRAWFIGIISIFHEFSRITVSDFGQWRLSEAIVSLHLSDSPLV